MILFGNLYLRPSCFRALITEFDLESLVTVRQIAPVARSTATRIDTEWLGLPLALVWCLTHTSLSQSTLMVWKGRSVAWRNSRILVGGYTAFQIDHEGYKNCILIPK